MKSGHFEVRVGTPQGFVTLHVEALSFRAESGVYLFDGDDGHTVASLPMGIVMSVAEPGAITTPKIVGLK